MKTSTDVTVVGAGPVGLLLATELALQGVRTTVLERLTTQADTIKAQMISGRTYQMLAMRGFGSAIDAASELESAGLAWRPTGATGHFAGLFKLDGLPLVMLSQQALERILEARALELGVQIHRGVEVTDLDFGSDYVVGCDGGRSTVRKLAGFDFPGTGPTLTGYQAIVDLDGDLPRGWHRTPNGICASGPLQGRIMLIDYAGPPTTRDVTPEILESALRRISGHDVRITAVHTATGLDRQHPPGHHLPQGQRPAGRRRGPRPFSVRRPGPQPGSPGRPEPGLETGHRRHRPDRLLHHRTPPGSRSGPAQHPGPGGSHPPRPAVT